MRRLLRRLRAHFTRRRDDVELAREMASHLALLEEEQRRRGLSPHEARHAARSAMDSVALVENLHRDARSLPWIEDALIDWQVAVRMLLASPGFAAVVVLTMALSIGATTTLFSLSYGVQMRPMPWPDADRVVRVFETRGGRAPRTIPNFQFPTTNHSQLPTPNLNVRLGVGNWEWLVVGRWQLGVIQ